MRFRLALLGVLALAACAAPRETRPAPLGPPCVGVTVWSNGVHTSLAVPAAALPRDHPIRRLAPGAHWFLVGWGERAFYRSDGRNPWLALDAVVPPSRSTVHVLASDTPPETWFLPRETAAIGLTPGGAERLAGFLADALLLDAGGGAQVIGPGQVAGRSWFLEGREPFHLFAMCNRWTARALSAGGVAIAGGAGWSADAVVRQARAAPACETPVE